jgi:hypothetical protein
VKPVSDTGRLLWHRLGAKTTELIHEHVHVEALHDDLETLVVDADLLEAVLGSQKAGVKLWEFETGKLMRSSPAIRSDGTVHVGSDDNKLYAIKSDSKGLAKSPWPMRGQNPLHTGRVMKK